jgi:hypothetical protein
MPRKKEPRKWTASDLQDIVAQAEAEGLVPSEPQAPKTPQTSKPKDTSLRESLERLDVFVEEAKAGMPDEELADRARVSLHAVAAWRRARRIKRPDISATVRTMRAHCLRPGDPERMVHYVAERTQGSVVEGWEPVRYCIRTALDYNEFTRHVYYLHHYLGSTTDTIARALGVRERDVDLALSIEASHLRNFGSRCQTCGNAMDPKYGAHCSWVCKRKRKRRGT